MWEIYVYNMFTSCEAKTSLIEIIIPWLSVSIKPDVREPSRLKTVHTEARNHILLARVMTAIYLPRSLLSKKHLAFKLEKLAGQAWLAPYRR